MPMNPDHQDLLAKTALEQAPKAMTGGGAFTSIVAWLETNPDLVTSLTGLGGFSIALAGFIWMVIRDLRKDRKTNNP
ncbi:MAG: hypothetical protein ACRBCS_03105 [Cellvibrionaceae bacterium]